MKIAGVQMDVRLGDVDANLERIVNFLRQTTADGARLTIFPECALTGYCFASLGEAAPCSQTIPGPATASLGDVCKELGSHCIVGLLEQDGAATLQRGGPHRTRRGDRLVP